MAVVKKGLGSKGKGLGALIDTELDRLDGGETVVQLDINSIYPNKQQPRRAFEEEALMELADSIALMGVIQPILVRQVGDSYEIIAGERRWRASKIAGLSAIPAMIKKYDSPEAFAVSLVENLQREDLNPMEEAISYRRLSDEFGYSQEEIAGKVGKNRATVANSMRLLQLDPRVQNFLAENKLTSGHGRALLPLPNGETQFEMAEHIIEEGLSVRAVETLVKQYLENLDKEEKSSVKRRPSQFHTESYPTLEKELRSIYGTKVKVSSGQMKGKIEIEFYSNEDLDRLWSMLKRTEE